MHTVILGAGGLGSVIGGFLAKGGHPVTFIARPAHAEAVQQAGLRISGDADFTVPAGRIRATADASEVTDADLLIVAVKNSATETALQSVAHLRPRMAASVQNGVIKNDFLKAAFGPEATIGATSVAGATLLEPGHALCTFLGFTYFGELGNEQSERVEEVVRACQESGLPCELPRDIQSVEWSKLCHIIPAASLSVLTRLNYHKVLLNPDLAGLYVTMARECAQVAEASGVEVGDYPAFNIRTLVEKPFEEGVATLVERGKAFEKVGRTKITVSMLQDVLAGKQTEADALLGDVVRRAERFGIAVPAISFACHCIRGIESWLGT